MKLDHKIREAETRLFARSGLCRSPQAVIEHPGKQAHGMVNSSSRDSARAPRPCYA
jgi:hypothetical protein